MEHQQQSSNQHYPSLKFHKTVKVPYASSQQSGSFFVDWLRYSFNINNKKHTQIDLDDSNDGDQAVMPKEVVYWMIELLGSDPVTWWLLPPPPPPPKKVVADA